MKTLLILLTTTLLFSTVVLAQTPVPAYELPKRGTITQIGPDGTYTTYYDRHGRDYWTLGPNGFSMQQERGGNVLRLEPLGQVDTFNKAIEDLRGGDR